MHKLMICCAVVCCALPAFAAEEKPAAAPAAGAMGDMSKMGPMARAPKSEKKDQKELQDWFKAYMAAGKKGDVNAMADMVDFPVMMMTDSMSGKFASSEVNRDQWIAMMKPMMSPEAQKAMKVSGQKGTCHILSDDLASCEGEMTMQMGKQKSKLNNQMTMTRVDGKWKVKTMMEAGWGDMKDMPAQAQGEGHAMGAAGAQPAPASAPAGNPPMKK